MTDKKRARIKQKKRAEMMSIKEQAARLIAADARAYFEKQGLRTKASNKKLIDDYRRLEKKLAVESISLCSMACLYALHNEFGYGANRLMETATEITCIITTVYSGERKLYDLIEECEIDLGLNPGKVFADLWQEQKVFLTGNDKHKASVLALAETIKTYFVISIYTIYFNKGFKTARMTRLLYAACDMITDVLLHDNDKMYRDELKDCGFICMKDGRYASEKLENKRADKINKVLKNYNCKQLKEVKEV